MWSAKASESNPAYLLASGLSAAGSWVFSATYISSELCARLVVAKMIKWHCKVLFGMGLVFTDVGPRNCSAACRGPGSSATWVARLARSPRVGSRPVQLVQPSPGFSSTLLLAVCCTSVKWGVSSFPRSAERWRQNVRWWTRDSAPPSHQAWAGLENKLWPGVERAAALRCAHCCQQAPDHGSHGRRNENRRKQGMGGRLSTGTAGNPHGQTAMDSCHKSSHLFHCIWSMVIFQDLEHVFLFTKMSLFRPYYDYEVRRKMYVQINRLGTIECEVSCIVDNGIHWSLLQALNFSSINIDLKCRLKNYWWVASRSQSRRCSLKVIVCPEEVVTSFSLPSNSLITLLSFWISLLEWSHFQISRCPPSCVTQWFHSRVKQVNEVLSEFTDGLRSDCGNCPPWLMLNPVS